MHTLSTLCDTWDKTNRIIGGATAGLVLFMVLLQTGIVIFRSLFNLGNLASQDSVLYMHAALIMLCLSWAFLCEGHVRVDVFYHRFSPLTRAWVNCLGNIVFLLPFAAFLSFSSWDYAIESWQNREASGDAGGLDRIYWLKALLPLCGGLLFLQGLSDTLKHILYLSFVEDDETSKTC